MINLFQTAIESLSVSKIGNYSRNEGFLASIEPYKMNDEISPILKEFFFKQFRDMDENYFRFSHDVSLEYHDMYNLANQIFGAPSKTHELSNKISELLYGCGNHPHIKNGELYVAYLTGISVDNNKVDAIGIFKSEVKTDFLQFSESESQIDLILQQGVNLGKLDKAAIILNHEKEHGYKILCFDKNNYDSKYWFQNFLGLDIFEDEHFHTKKYMKFVQDFAKEVVLPAEDKKEEVMFLNRSANYFAKNDEFEETNFLNEVLDNPDLIPEFKNYKVEKAPKYSIEDLTSFTISNSAANDARKKFKSVINLDTGITLKLDFINPESAEKFLEKGWDEEKQMYYYLAYFNKEQA